MPENDITELQTLDIYQLTEEQYNDLVSSSEFDQNALYMTPASNAVASVNGQTPDANGNVDTAEIWHGDEVGSLPVPINADQLQGHPASYFQPTISGSNGINVANNTVSLGQFGTITIPSENLTNVSGATIRLHYLGPLVFVDFYTTVTCINSGKGWTEMFKLPTGFYPQERLKSACVDDSSMSDGVVSMIEARVETTGEFRLYAPVSGHKYWGGTIMYFRSV